MAKKEHEPPPKSERGDPETDKATQEERPIVVSSRQFNDFALI